MNKVILTVVAIAVMAACSKDPELRINPDIEYSEEYLGTYISKKSEWVGNDSLGNRIIETTEYYNGPKVVDFIVRTDSIFI